ncbi:MAG TPA: ATP-binding protein [Bryobacteraceae bacterium]|nr:ATP-binding protein [Bryobacteraceae bacterium]
MEETGESDLTREDLIHDLNNVFETITEAAELLSADRRWKALAATLGRTVARGKRLLGAIPDSTPLLAPIVENAIQSVTDYCIATRKPRMRFVRQLRADTRLPGSAKDWERVFVNLFLNAAQIMQKPGRIDIEAQQEDGMLCITVSDNGPGIPAEILPRMFRSNVSTKTSRSRSGLGLRIVASIVRKYAGRVAAANRERGNGAVFTISLPVF